MAGRSGSLGRRLGRGRPWAPAFAGESGRGGGGGRRGGVDFGAGGASLGASQPETAAVTFTLYEASAPVFVRSLRNMERWLDKAGAWAEAGPGEAALLEARLAPDMRPFPAQIQLASDSAKGAVARLTGVAAPAMADTEGSLAELRDRIVRTVAFVEGVDAGAYAGAEEREVVLRTPSGAGWRWTGRDYLTGFALPNFFFHVTTAYGLLRGAGVELGKPDFLAHLGPPNLD